MLYRARHRFSDRESTMLPPDLHKSRMDWITDEAAKSIFENVTEGLQEQIYKHISETAHIYNSPYSLGQLVVDFAVDVDVTIRPVSFTAPELNEGGKSNETI